MTSRSLQLAILGVLGNKPNIHRFTMLGRGSNMGTLERVLGVRMTTDQRALADLAIDKLRIDGLIRPTFTDTVDPGAWLEITAEGRIALERRALDSLDLALANISATLPELREGAWAAVASSRPDSLRQASHSARELVDQTLKLGAPDAAVRAVPGFVPDATSRDGITRRHRMKYVMARSGAISGSRLEVAEKACDLVVAAADRLLALAHSRPVPARQDVEDSLKTAEIALRSILLNNTAV